MCQGTWAKCPIMSPNVPSRRGGHGTCTRGHERNVPNVPSGGGDMGHGDIGGTTEPAYPPAVTWGDPSISTATTLAMGSGACDGTAIVAPLVPCAAGRALSFSASR